MEKQNYIEVSYTSVFDMLQKMKDQLVEMKKDHESQVKAIEQDIRDCELAMTALNPQEIPPIPKNFMEVLDELDRLQHTDAQKTAEFKSYSSVSEQPTPEDLANLHSYLHVNNEPKKPYRIKTRQEMIDGGAVDDNFGGLKIDEKHFYFCRPMSYLHGRELESNGLQKIDSFMIEPWMITKNN